MAAGHLLEWADGESSAARLVMHMRNAVEDGFSHPMVTRLGTLPPGNNAQRGLKELMADLGLFRLQTVIEEAEAVTRTIL